MALDVQEPDIAEVLEGPAGVLRRGEPGEPCQQLAVQLRRLGVGGADSVGKQSVRHP
jgi:hypothetical protein